MNDVVLIPSARLVPPELRIEFGPVPSGMVPLRGRPALEHIAESPLVGDRPLLVALHEGADEVHGWLDRQRQVRPELVEVGPTRYLGETILVALDSLEVVPDRVIVHFADTIVTAELPDGDFVMCREQTDTYRYTTFAVGPDGAVEITSEPGEITEDPEPVPVFVGVFGIADIPAFAEILRVAVDRGVVAGIDPFYQALSEYSRDHAVAVQQVEEWHDFGHLDTYYATKRSAFIGARSFNRVDVDPARGVVRKTSANPAKFIDEILWYLRIPKRLAHIAPRTFEYSIDPTNPWVELEFYGYPNLNDAYLVGQWDLGVWGRVFAGLTSLLEEMQSFQHVPVSGDELDSALHEMYLDKTRNRLAELSSKAPSWLSQYAGERVVIDGREMRGLAAVQTDLEQILTQGGVLEADRLSVIHGDLCLSNLLYDQRNGIVRTIDPRGRFGSFDIYGDPRYDLAKLAHSLRGDYDLLLAGRFDLDVVGSDHVLTVHLSERQRAVKKLFARWLATTWPGADRSVRLIESLLFLSLVPLHNDNERAQEAFVARGLALLDAASPLEDAADV
jgi:hypothetical protein